MRMQLSNVQSQKLIMTTSQYLSLRILQMNSADLTAYINDIAVENPFVDFIDDTALGYIAPSFRHDVALADGAAAGFQPVAAYRPEDMLLLQLAMLRVTPEEERIARFLIDCIDDAGYLTVTTKKAAEILQTSNEAVTSALRRIHSMEPAGVGARCVSECLLLQIERDRGITPALSELVTGHLDALAAHRYAKIAAALKITEDDARQMAAYIRTLSPRPYNGFSGEPTYFVKPDVYIAVDGDAVLAEENAENLPRVHLNEKYLALMENPGDGDTAAYMKKCLKEARELSQCVDARYSTVMRIAGIIAKLQTPFFYGAAQFPAPLQLKDVAAIAGLSISTVSRAISGVYLQCARGTFPFGYFFPKPVSSGGSEVNPELIKEKLVRLFETEDPNHPWSDQRIVELLRVQTGFAIARRTVAKYRDELGVPKASVRRAARVKE